MALRNKSSTGHDNAFTRYLDAAANGELSELSKTELDAAFGAVRSEFTALLSERGLETRYDIHHWNFNRPNYPDQLVHPRNLFITNGRYQHDSLHQTLTDGRPYRDPINPVHRVLFPTNSYPVR